MSLQTVGNLKRRVVLTDNDGNPITILNPLPVTLEGSAFTIGKVDQGDPAITSKRWPVQLTDGTDLVLVTTNGELNVIATAQPGVDIGDVTINNTVSTPVPIRLSDGSAFYDATKTGQLPSALVGSRLDINNGAWLGSTAPTVGQKAMASSIPVTLASDQSSLLVDTELPSAVALADDTANPTVPGVAAFLMARDSAGGDNWDRLVASTQFDLDSGAGTQNVLGVVLRSTASGGSVETFPTPLILNDAIVTPTLTRISTFPHIYNGSTFDRPRSVVNGQDTIGTGITAAGILGQFDDTSTGTVTENQFAPVRISSRRALLVEGVASGTALLVDTELPAATALADDESATAVMPRIGAVMMGMDATGAANIDRAVLAKGWDMDTGAGTEYAIGISLRKSASGGSSEYGSSGSPFSIDQRTLAGTTVAVNTGNASAGTQRVVLASDQPIVSVDTEFSAAVQLADTMNATPTTPIVGAVSFLMNAPTLDRQRSVVNALNSAGIGIVADGLCGQLDDTSPSSVTENQWAPVRITSLRALHTHPRDNAGAVIFTASAALADGVTNPTEGRIADDMNCYNGSTWDRVRSMTNATNSTGTGILASGIIAQLDDTSPTAITENQFGNVRMSALRGIHNQPSWANRSDTYTTTANGTTIDLTSNPFKNFSIQVVATGTVTSWDVRLEGSNDGTNFAQIIQHTNTDGTGIIKFAANSVCRYFRSRCAGLVLGTGTNVIAYICGSA